MLIALGPNPSVGNVSTFGGMAGVGEHNVNSTIGLNHIFAPTVIAESRLGYLPLRVHSPPQNFELDPSTFIPGLPPQDIGGVPQVSINNIVSMSEAGSRDIDQSLQYVQN